ncbi:MAG: hypothetical protein WC526_00745 [Patescibacteria group bacterium]
MAKVDADEISAAIREVLANASTGKGTTRAYLTAYQILKRLPQALQDTLQAEYGRSGKGGGWPFGPATRVAQVASGLHGVHHVSLDTRGLQFDVGQTDEVEAGYNLCALFRLT